MKKLNNKGFTLIELLAVVVILLAISVMAISSISAAIERNKVKQDATKKDIIKSYAELYYDEHKNSVAMNYTCSDGEGFCIPISVLNLSDEEKTDANGNVFSGYVKITLSGKNVQTEYIDN